MVKECQSHTGAIWYNKSKEETAIQIEENNNLKAEIGPAVSEENLKHYYNITFKSKSGGYGDHASLNQWKHFFTYEKNMTLLHLAAQDGDTNAIKKLINKKAKFKKDIDGRTPLHYAAIAGKKEALETIIEYDISEINRQDKYGNTPLHYASNLDCVESLVAKEAKKTIRNDKGHIPLHFAAINNLTECAEHLMKHLNIAKNRHVLNAKDSQGCAFLHYAAKSGVDTKYIRYLYKHDLRFVDRDGLIADKSGKSLLFYAAMSGSCEYFIDFYTSLITIDGFKSEFEIGRKDEDGATILHHTAQSDEEGLLKFIIEQGVNQSNPVHLSNSKNCVIKDAKGRSLLHYAAQSKTGNCLQFLINQLEKDRTKYRIDLSQEINMQDEDGNTPLHYAAKEGNWECVELLCKRGANIYLVDKNGMNPLHIASRYGHVSCAKLLISHNKNKQDYINSKTLNGETPFLLSISGNHENCAQLLKNAWGNPYDCNNIGATALHYGARGGIECLNFTIEAMKNFGGVYNINTCDEYGRTPLHFTRNKECFEALIQNGADFVDQGKLIRDHHNKTILHYIAASGDASFMEFLLKELKKHKVDISKEINHQDDSGRMPLYYAIDQENLEMVKLLLSINTQFAAEEIDGCIKGGLRKLLTYNVSNKDEILHTKDKYDKTIYDYVLESNAIPVLKLFSDFSSQMKKLKKRFHDKLDNQFLSKFAYFSIIYTNIMAFIGIRSFFKGDFFGKHELLYFATSIPIVNASLNNCLLYAKRKLNESEKISNTYEENRKKISIKISEIEQKKADETQDIKKQIQQCVEAEVGEGSASDSQKQCLDDLLKEERKISPFVKKVLLNLLLNSMNKNNRPKPTEPCVKAQNKSNNRPPAKR